MPAESAKDANVDPDDVLWVYGVEGVEVEWVLPFDGCRL